MRSFAVLAGVLASLAIPGAACADTVGTATTTTGQTLTVSIDSPSDGALEPGPYVQMSGHATLGPAPEGQAGTSITRVADGGGDGYGTPGSYWAQDALFDPATGAWSEAGRWGYRTRNRVYATAIAADGTQATATISLALGVEKETYPVRAEPVFGSPEIDSAPALRATMFDRGPLYGLPIDFFVGSEKVCTASIGNKPGNYAVCDDPAVVQQAIAAGGYTARFEETDHIYGSSASAGLVYTGLALPPLVRAR